MYKLFNLSQNELTEMIKSMPHKEVPLKLEDIKKCIGCWSCWTKTPGECVFKDSMESTYHEFITGDKIIIHMDTENGFINHHAKAFLDRSIPHYLPYIMIEDGECHHKPRYDSYPELYFSYDTTHLTDDEENVIEDYLYRAAYHYRCKSFRIKDNTLLPLVHRDAATDLNTIKSYPIKDRLIIYNGSPRLKNSNTSILIEHFLSWYPGTYEIRDLKDTAAYDSWADSFKTDENVLFFFPLYVHAMPSHMMAFIEKLQASHGSIGFFVQSGFPESSQSHYIRPYFELLAKRLERNYTGTVIKGGCEGIQIMPAKAVEPLFKQMKSLGLQFYQKGCFTKELTDSLSTPIYLSPLKRGAYKFLSLFGVTDFYWNRSLKANSAFKARYNKPYE